MEYHLRNRNPLVRSSIVLLLVIALATTPGCVTTLGYVPEQIKPADKSTYIPTYSEVKKWANDVADGYDTRATINQGALYAGALLAAAGIGALTGLAIFDSTSSWIKGIPIGTAFFGSVFAIYSNEEKAQIYRLGSKYAVDIVTGSDKRLVRRRLASNMTAKALQESQAAEAKAIAARDNAKAQLQALQEQAKQAHNAADAAAASPGKDAKTKVAQAIDQEVAKMAGTITSANTEVQAAQERTEFAQNRNQAWNELNAAKSTEDRARIAAAEAVWAQFSDHEGAEALCLRSDISNLMRRVEEHKAFLDPKNVAQHLKNVQASNTAAPGGIKTSSDNTSIVKPDDLSDLNPPVKSQCDNAV